MRGRRERGRALGGHTNSNSYRDSKSQSSSKSTSNNNNTSRRQGEWQRGGNRKERMDRESWGAKHKMWV